MINGFYQDSQIGNQLYLSVNYTSYLFSFLNPLICSFIFACFPAVANYIAIHNKKKLQECKIEDKIKIVMEKCKPEDKIIKFEGKIAITNINFEKGAPSQKSYVAPNYQEIKTTS